VLWVVVALALLIPVFLPLAKRRRRALEAAER
jgi:hypothetical protein